MGVAFRGGVAKQSGAPHWVWPRGCVVGVAGRGRGSGGRGQVIRYRQNGEILPLAALTYGSLGVALAGLLLAVLVLSALRGLRSNRHSIRRHGACALLLAQLVFLLGINQAELPVGRGEPGENRGGGGGKREGGGAKMGVAVRGGGVINVGGANGGCGVLGGGAKGGCGSLWAGPRVGVVEGGVASSGRGHGAWLPGV